MHYPVFHFIYRCSTLAAFIGSIICSDMRFFGVFFQKYICTLAASQLQTLENSGVCFRKYQSTLDRVIAQLKRNEQKDAIHQALIN